MKFIFQSISKELSSSNKELEEPFAYLGILIEPIPSFPLLMAYFFRPYFKIYSECRDAQSFHETHNCYRILEQLGIRIDPMYSHDDYFSEFWALLCWQDSYFSTFLRDPSFDCFPFDLHCSEVISFTFWSRLGF